MTQHRWGLLLLNLGTPDSPRVPDVRRYLREFLSDPLVIDIPAVPRWLLVNLRIAPFRAPQSAEAYEKVWTERGSPLLFHTEDLATKVRARLGGEAHVVVAMRYGKPSIASALTELRRENVHRVVVLPLFPQRSTAAWSSAVLEVFAQAAALPDVPAFSVVPPFHDDPGFLRAFATVARPVFDDFTADRVLFSFHGIPERQVLRCDPERRRGCLATPDCCATLTARNRDCYRAQCFATARGIAAELGLADGAWEVAFQSRLGRTPWIRPFTDVRLVEMAREGVRRVVVFSPAFVADCLETLEEIALRNAADFRAAGGEELRLVPSLNSHDAWADAVTALARNAAGAPSRAQAPATEPA